MPFILRVRLFIALLILAAQACCIPLNMMAEDHSEQFALLVGIDKYKDSRWDTLRGPGNDVALIRGLLVKKYQFPDDNGSTDSQSHIRTLIGIQATHQQIKDVFQHQLIDNAHKFPNARVVFYYSGHGSLMPDSSGTNGGEYRASLVPADRDVNGVSDISDQELRGWLSELRKYTNRITVILDSCYSGSPTRAIELQLTTKEVPPDPALTGASAKGAMRGPVFTPLVSLSDGIALLYSSLRYEKSTETDLSDSDGTLRRHGVFTYYLVQALMAEPSLSYRAAVDRVSGILRRSYGQDPEAAGSPEKPAFYSEGIDEDPFIKITSGAISGRQFSIQAGTSLTLQGGEFIAIYNASSKQLRGEDGKLAMGRVTNVRQFDSDAELSASPTTPIPADSKVVIVTPHFGNLRLRVNLATDLPSFTRSRQDQMFADKLKIRLNGSKLVDLESTQWDIGIQIACSDSSGRPLSFYPNTGKGGAASSCVTPRKDVAYLVAANGRGPLFDYWVPPTEDNVEGLALAVEQDAKQENLRALANARSPLNGKIGISLIRVNTEVDASGEESQVSEDELANDTAGVFQIREQSPKDHLRLKILNNSTRDLDVALIALETSGAVHILTPRGVGTEIKGQGSLYESDIYDVNAPSGVQTFMVIAYTHSVDFQDSPNFLTLEQPGVPSLNQKGLTDPLSWLVQQSASGISRDTPPSPLNLSSWTVIKINAILHY